MIKFSRFSISLFLIIIVVHFSGCLEQKDIQAQEIIISSEDYYYDYLDELIKHYWDEEYEVLLQKIEISKKKNRNPIYEDYVFNALAAIQIKDRQAAKNILTNYSLMLKIDEGSIKCSSIQNLLTLKSGNSISNAEVYSNMCWEMAMSFYGSTDSSILKHREAFVLIFNDILEKVERIE